MTKLILPQPNSMKLTYFMEQVGDNYAVVEWEAEGIECSFSMNEGENVSLDQSERCANTSSGIITVNGADYHVQNVEIEYKKIVVECLRCHLHQSAFRNHFIGGPWDGQVTAGTHHTGINDGFWFIDLERRNVQAQAEKDQEKVEKEVPRHLSKAGYSLEHNVHRNTLRGMLNTSPLVVTAKQEVTAALHQVRWIEWSCTGISTSSPSKAKPTRQFWVSAI